MLSEQTKAERRYQCNQRRTTGTSRKAGPIFPTSRAWRETTHPETGTQPVRQETINNNHIFRIKINSTVFTQRLLQRQGYLRKPTSKVYKLKPWFLFTLSSNVYKLKPWFLFARSSKVYKLQPWFLFALSSNVYKLQPWFLFALPQTFTNYNLDFFLRFPQTFPNCSLDFCLHSPQKFTNYNLDFCLHYPNAYKLQPWFLFTLSLALKRLWRFEFANILFLFSEVILSRIMTESMCVYTHIVGWAQSTNQFSSV